MKKILLFILWPVLYFFILFIQLCIFILINITVTGRPTGAITAFGGIISFWTSYKIVTWIKSHAMTSKILNIPYAIAQASGVKKEAFDNKIAEADKQSKVAGLEAEIELIDEIVESKNYKSSLILWGFAYLLGLIIVYLLVATYMPDPSNLIEQEVKGGNAVIVEPVDSDDYYSRGLELYGLKDYSGSIREFTKALESGPNLVDPYVQRARAKCALGDNSGGVLDLDKAILIDPDDVYKYKLRGDAHYNLRNWTLALQDYTMGIELSPRDKHLYHWRGWAYRKKGEISGYINERKELFLLSCQDWRVAGDMGYEPSLTHIIEYCQ